MTQSSQTSYALTLPREWGTLPPLGDLNAYISAVQRFPMLSPEEEKDLLEKFRLHHNLEAAGKLVLSHLRVVVSISRQYLGYGLPHSDLIQEGTIGLMKAVKRFDSDKGVRLVSYALHWIKAEIHEYILRNWRMVKVAATKPQRKLFFKLRSLKQSLKDEPDAQTHRESLTETQIETVARQLDVKAQTVREMEITMSAGDVSLDPLQDDDSETFRPTPYLSDSRHEPSVLLENKQRDAMANEGLPAALAKLDARSQHIVRSRWLDTGEDGNEGLTLHELAAEYGVSAERIRQIEAAALKKLKAHLAPAPLKEAQAIAA